MFTTGLLLDLVFDFANFSAWVFVVGQCLTLLFLGLSLMNLSHDYLVTIFIFTVLSANQVNLLIHPKAFHVLVYWVGLSPLALTGIAKRSKLILWIGVLAAYIVANGVIINQKIGPYSLVISPTLFIVAGLFFLFTTTAIAFFFSFTQNLTWRRMSEKNIELAKLSEEIEQQNIQLKDYNETLEARVYERTKALEYQNRQLAEYAYINSHLVRGPLARIIGLTNLISRTPKTAEQQELIENLNQASAELDSVIFSINNALIRQQEFDRKTLKDETDVLADE